MRRMRFAAIAAASLALSSCGPAGIDVAAVITACKEACQFAPDPASVADICKTPGVACNVANVSGIICNAVKQFLAKGGANKAGPVEYPTYNDKPIHGEFTDNGKKV